MSKRDWCVKRRLSLSDGPMRVYRRGLTEQEAHDLAMCHNRAFPSYLHEAALAPQRKAVKRGR